MECSWDSVKNEYFSANKLLEEVEDNVSSLSSKIPFDLNSKILYLSNLISRNLKFHENLIKIKEKQKRIKLKDKNKQTKEVFVHNPIKFTDLDFFDQLSQNFNKDLSTIFEEIQNQQSNAIKQFIRNNPGPYYFPSTKMQSINKEKFHMIQNQIKEFETMSENQLSSINIKLHSFLDKLEEKETQISLPLSIKSTMNQQIDSLKEIQVLTNQIQQRIKAEQKRKELEEIRGHKYEKEDQIVKAENQLFDQYHSLENKIHNIQEIFTMMHSHFNSDFTELKSIVQNVQNKLEANQDILENAKSFIEKAQIKYHKITTFSESLQEEIEKLKKQQLDIKSTNEFKILEENCNNFNKDDETVLDNSKNIIKELETMIYDYKMRH